MIEIIMKKKPASKEGLEPGSIRVNEGRKKYQRLTNSMRSREGTR